jgi:hypothetical protein
MLGPETNALEYLLAPPLKEISSVYSFWSPINSESVNHSQKVIRNTNKKDKAIRFVILSNGFNGEILKFAMFFLYRKSTAI